MERGPSMGAAQRLPDERQIASLGGEGWPEDVAAPLAEVMTRVRARQDELARLVFEAVRRCPGYGELGRDGLAEVAAGVATSVDLLIGMLGTGRRLALADLQAMSALGAQRARQGVPLAGVLASVSAGISRGWQLFADEASALACDADRVAVLDAVDPWFSDALAVASEAMARGYLDAQVRPPGAPPPARASRVASVLSGVVDDAHEVACRLRATPWEPSARHGLVLFAALTRCPVAPSVLGQARVEWMAAVPGALGGARHFDPVPHAATVTCVQPAAWGDVTVVAGRVAERLGLVALVADDTVDAGDVDKLYRSMTDVLCLAADVARTPGTLKVAALGVPRLVAAVPEPVRDAVLGRLVARLRELQAGVDGCELVDTLEAVAELGGVANAAVSLGVDRRTVGRRLARLEQRLGVSLTDRADRLLVELALHAMRLRSQPTPFDGRSGAITPLGARNRASGPQIARIVQ